MKGFNIKTFGCSSNIADSEFVKNILQKNNYNYSESKFDFYIINSCSVKGPTVNKIKDFIKKIFLPKHKIIIMGCLPSDKKILLELKDYSIISPYNIDLIDKAIIEIERTKKPIKYLEPKFLDKTKFDYSSKNIAIVQPLIGCMGNCYYCKTKLAKPKFYSYPLENILKRIDNYIKNGVKEIWLSSEDNAAYGVDIGKTYMDLLLSIEEKFAGKAMFRLGMSNPWLLLKKEKQLIDFFKKTKAFYKFLHIPIQSASSKVLKDMNRPYTEKQLEKFFLAIRKNFSENKLNLTTDVIVGYPNETKEDYLKTKRFIKKYKFLVTNVSQIWPMPFTKTFEMKQLSTEIKKERSRDLSQCVRNILSKYLKKQVNKTIDIYFNNLDENGNLLGRTNNYISVILKKPKKIDYGWRKCKIKAIENYHLIV